MMYSNQLIRQADKRQIGSGFMKAIKTSKRYKLVIRAIQNYIIDNNLEAGDRLPTENELAEKLQVGRSSVREAVKSLEVLGVIETKAGEGMFVRSFNFLPILENLPYSMMFDRDDLSEVLEIRITLELSNLKKVIDNIDAEHLKKIELVVEKMKKSRESNDIVAFVEADERFHKLLFQPVNNELLKKLLGIFWTLLENAKDFSKLADPNLQAGYKKHKAIYQALAEKDHDKLYKLLEKHYEVSKKNIAANQLKVGV